MGDFWASVGPYTPIPALVALVIYGLRSILVGKLVNRTQLEDLREDRDTQLADKNEQVKLWHESYNQSEAARALQSEQVGTLLTQVGLLLEQGKTTEHLIRSLQEAAAEAARQRGVNS